MTIFFDQKSGTPVALPILAAKRLIPQYNSFSNAAIPSVVNNKVHVTQLGSNALISFFWGGGTATVTSSNVITFNMPAGLTINVALTAGVTADHLGAADWFTNVSGGTHKPLKPQILSSTTVMFCDEYNGQNFIESAVGTGWLISGWIIVPIVEWAGMDTSSTGVSGGGAGGLLPVTQTISFTALANSLNMIDHTGGTIIVATLPVITTATSVTFVYAKGTVNDTTSFLRVIASNADTITDGAIGDTEDFKYGLYAVTYSKAAGSSVWYAQYQMLSMNPPGMSPGYTGSTAIPVGMIGEALGTVRSGTNGESKSYRSNVVLTIANQILLTATVNKGVYLFGYVINSSWSLDGYVQSTVAKVGGTSVIYGTNNPSKANLQVTSSAGPIPILITADSTVVTVEGSWSGGIGTAAANYHEMWIVRIA